MSRLDTFRSEPKHKEEHMNKHTNDAGGPAFAHSGNDACPRQEGMTLRDYFAGQAMQGLLAQCQGGGFTAVPVGIVKTSFDFADAMLAERARPNQRNDERL
jgi:hypothetical protein